MQLTALDFSEKVFGNIIRCKQRLEARIRGVQKCSEDHEFSNLINLERELQD